MKNHQATVQPGPQVLAVQPGMAPARGATGAANPKYPTGAQRFLRINPQNGRMSIVQDSILQGGSQSKASPAPLVTWPSTSSNIPHTSALSANNIDKSSLAFIARTMHANLPSVNNHNANGQLNA